MYTGYPQNNGYLIEHLMMDQWIVGTAYIPTNPVEIGRIGCLLGQVEGPTMIGNMRTPNRMVPPSYKLVYKPL